MKLKHAVAAVASAFCATAASAVTIQLPTGAINALSLDWAPTSFLAKGGISAIQNFVGSGGECLQGACDFSVYTHAKATAYDPGTGFVAIPGANSSFELTLVASFRETVTFVAPDFARFGAQAGSGFFQLYLDSNVNANDLGGVNFNDGRLIAVGILGNSASGNFEVTDRTAVQMDNFGNNDWPSNETVIGIGSQGSLNFTVLEWDPTVFTDGLLSLGILFQNVSIALPWESVDPSRCFNNQLGRGVGDVGDTFASTNCNLEEQGDGIWPNIGAVNGDTPNAPDFMAQTDFNSPLRSESIPEPASLALIAGALIAAGGISRRRRDKKA